MQSLAGHYGGSQSQVWSWFVGAVPPTLGLIVAVLAAEALQGSAGPKLVDAFFYRVSLGVSAAYLLSLWAVVLMPPLRSDLQDGLPELIGQVGHWLGMLQGLVTASLGVFYVRRDKAG